MKNINTTSIQEIIKYAYRRSLGTGLREVTYYDRDSGDVYTTQDVSGGNSMPIGILDGSAIIICVFDDAGMSAIRDTDMSYQRELLIRAGKLDRESKDDGDDVLEDIADGSLRKLIEMYPEISAAMDQELIDMLVDEFDPDEYIELHRDPDDID